jgi:hypothetical protein
MFVDGVQVATNGYNPAAISSQGLPLTIGYGNEPQSGFNGLMSNFRWTTVYVELPYISYPPPTSPLTVLPETKLLMFQGTTLEDEITDQSGNGYTIRNATGFYNPNNPFGSPNEGCIAFGYDVAFTFKSDNTSGNAGTSSDAQYTYGTSPISADYYVNWGDGSGIENRLLEGGNTMNLNHSFASTGIFDVTVYTTSVLGIDNIANNSDKGNFLMLED